MLPVLALLTLLAVQLALVGWGLWTSAAAARAGARAQHVGGDPRAAALSAVPAPLRQGARASGEPFEVSVRVPSLIPGVDGIPVSGRASLDPSGDG